MRPASATIVETALAFVISIPSADGKIGHSEVEFAIHFVFDGIKNPLHSNLLANERMNRTTPTVLAIPQMQSHSLLVPRALQSVFDDGSLQTTDLSIRVT